MLLYICHNIIINLNFYLRVENGVTPLGFVQSDADDFDDLGLTKFGKKRVLKILKEVSQS